MNWEQAEALMKSRGYFPNSVGRTPSGQIVKMTFMRSVPVNGVSITIMAYVTSVNECCDNCWNVELLYGSLKLFMTISSGQFALTHKEFEKYEQVISLYAYQLRNFNPLEK